MPNTGVPPISSIFGLSSIVDGDVLSTPRQAMINIQKANSAILGSGAGLDAQGFSNAVDTLETLLLNSNLSDNSLDKNTAIVNTGIANTVMLLSSGQESLENIGLQNNQLLREGSRQLGDFMNRYAASFGATGEDMMNPRASIIAAVGMIGDRILNGINNQEKEAGNTRQEFMQQLTDSGVSPEQAYAAADAIDMNKDDNITDKEIDKYASSQNSVVDKIIKDPRFRNRLVKRRPYQSIYGDNYSSQYNQTDIAEQGAALDDDSYNVSNVVYDD